MLAFGALLIGIACLMATDLTSEWATDDFLPSQILQAIGQSFALTALLVLIVRSINPGRRADDRLACCRSAACSAARSAPPSCRPSCACANRSTPT